MPQRTRQNRAEADRLSKGRPEEADASEYDSMAVLLRPLFILLIGLAIGLLGKLLTG